MRRLENKCDYWDIARIQRETENLAGLGNEGTEGFENRGCYICDGYFKECLSYFTVAELNSIGGKK